MIVCHLPFQVSMTMPLSRQRSQVAIPAQGMVEIRDALTDLLNEFGTEDLGSYLRYIALLIANSSVHASS